MGRGTCAHTYVSGQKRKTKAVRDIYSPRWLVQIRNILQFLELSPSKDSPKEQSQARLHMCEAKLAPLF